MLITCTRPETDTNKQLFGNVGGLVYMLTLEMLRPILQRLKQRLKKQIHTTER